YQCRHLRARSSGARFAGSRRTLRYADTVQSAETALGAYDRLSDARTVARRRACGGPGAGEIGPVGRWRTTTLSTDIADRSSIQPSAGTAQAKPGVGQRDVVRQYNLPVDVQFCKKCTVSNQRPRITFDAQGVCSACNFAEYKRQHFDWQQR